MELHILGNINAVSFAYELENFTLLPVLMVLTNIRYAQQPRCTFSPLSDSLNAPCVTAGGNFQEDAWVFLSEHCSCESPVSGKMLTCPLPAEGAAGADSQGAICVLLLNTQFLSKHICSFIHSSSCFMPPCVLTDIYVYFELHVKAKCGEERYLEIYITGVASPHQSALLLSFIILPGKSRGPQLIAGIPSALGSSISPKHTQPAQNSSCLCLGK